MQRPIDPTIMVVDDDDDVRTPLRDWLNKSGYHTVEAKNGYEAIDIAQREHPSLIFMDLRMPVLNGIATTRRLRDHAQLRDVLIVVTSGLDPALFRDVAFSVGCTDYLAKPFDFEQLSNLLNRLLPISKPICACTQNSPEMAS